MTQKKKKNKPFWKTKRFWGAALTTISGGLTLFTEDFTVAHKVGVFLGVGVAAFGLLDKKTDYKLTEKIKNKLPSGLSK